MKTKIKRRVTNERLLAGSILDEEIKLELDAVADGVKRYRELANVATARGDGAQLKPAERLLLHWMGPLINEIKTEKRAIRRKEKAGEDRANYAPILLQIAADRAAAVVIQEILSLVMAEPEGVTWARACYAVGKGIVAEINYDLLRDEAKGSIAELQRRCRSLDAGKVNHWAKKKLEDPVWHMKIHMTLGSRLVWALITTANCNDYDADEFYLAFHHVKRYRNRRKTAYLVADDRVFDIIEDGHAVRQFLRPRYLPMIVEPYPWQDDAEGGYVKIRTPFVSKPSQTQKALLDTADLSQIHECLNVLGKTPWQINRRIYDVVQQFWRDGRGGLGIPPAENVPYEPKPTNFDTDEKARDEWFFRYSKIRRKNRELVSARMDFARRMYVAEKFIDRPVFYLPHQMDFRGRCYPIPPHLNHHMDDAMRGMLRFANPRPIDDRGRYWLRVHMANCCGADKVPFDQRAAWTQSRMPEIKEWATNPAAYDGWSRADKPFQALAAAMALFDDDEAARLPIQMDGTCNGLQHYAAIMRDEKGGRAVNLTPSDNPADVYSAVASLVEGVVRRDGKDGLLALVDRKLAKPVVMTSVYGVTKVGARQAVQKRLEELGVFAEDDYKAMYHAAFYLSNAIMEAMGSVCRGATDAMAWLADCARIIVNDAKQPVQWTTPLGLPVVQPYRQYSTISVRTISGYVQALVPDDSVPVRAGKQISGFPPNFIHSIDATHMLMTARAAYRDGLDFAEVHDSFWAHANDVDQLGRILREQFVALHQRDIFGDLARAFRDHYRIDVPEPPSKGNLNIEAVRAADYFFS